MPATQAQAIVFETPQHLSLRTLELKSFEVGDVHVQVSREGISTGTERLPWDGCMPPFPGLGYPLVQSGALSLQGLITHTFNPPRAREAYEVAFGDPQCQKMMIDWRG